jgi:hypothetical protein
MSYDVTQFKIKQATSIGMVSLVGFSERKFPMHCGNYFEVMTNDRDVYNGYEIANFWYEDLKHLLDTGVVKFPLDIKVLNDHWAILYDAQIPPEFYSETSYRAPEEFWSLTQRAKRQLKIDTGEMVVHKSGGMTWESYHVKSSKRTLAPGWTYEETK